MPWKQSSVSKHSSLPGSLGYEGLHSVLVYSVRLGVQVQEASKRFAKIPQEGSFPNLKPFSWLGLHALPLLRPSDPREHLPFKRSLPLLSGVSPGLTCWAGTGLSRGLWLCSPFTSLWQSCECFCELALKKDVGGFLFCFFKHTTSLFLRET